MAILQKDEFYITEGKYEPDYFGMWGIIIKK